MVVTCVDHAQNVVLAKRHPERTTEWVAVLIAPTEKAADADRPSSLGLSLQQFFREGGALCVIPSTQGDEEETLEAALKKLELSTRCAEQTLDQALAEVRAALNAGS